VVVGWGRESWEEGLDIFAYFGNSGGTGEGIG
jgi:hypothetical protein